VQIRNTPAEIQDYFVKFLTSKPQAVIDESHVQIWGPTVASRTGIYTFTLTTDGIKSNVTARFSFVYRKEQGAWKIEQQHSSVLPEQDLPTENEVSIDWLLHSRCPNPDCWPTKLCLYSFFRSTLSRTHSILMQQLFTCYAQKAAGPYAQLSTCKVSS
jgi:hypothetical protein